MRRALPLLGFSTLLALTTTLTHAQKDRFAYAITDLTPEGSNWNALRKIDLQTGTYSTVLLNGADAGTMAFDAATKKPITTATDARLGQTFGMPFGTGVAAAAYDRKHHRLYFTPMFIDQLRYIDLRTMKVYYVADQLLTGFGNMHNDEAKIITRMAIAPDGTGYAISNDGNTFVQFTTGSKTKIKSLGRLVDDPANNGISIHNKCSSFGGDMIADDAGYLYILSARNQVFKLNTQTKVATHLGAISGLPQAFTVNGAVVDAEGSLLVSSAVDATAYYVVNTADWKATPYTLPASVFRSSDLANSNFLSTAKNTTIETVRRTPVIAHAVAVYPNPVTAGRFTLQFSKIPKGDYTVELVDALGRSVLQKRITVGFENEAQDFTLPSKNAKGTYLVKLLDRQNKPLFDQKVMVQ